MELTEHIALYLRAHGLPAALALPPEPDEAVAVIATDLRPPADSAGSRFRVLIRSAPGGDTAIALCARVMELLGSFCGLLTPDSPLILRARVEGGAALWETDRLGRATYSINFRAWHC